MSTTQVSSRTATEATGAAPVPLRLEVVTCPSPMSIGPRTST